MSTHLVPLSLLVACTGATTPTPEGGSSDLLAALEAFEADAATVDAHLATFDTLDFDVFSNEQWDRLHESHADDVVVHWPDGHSTQGIDVHVTDLQAMFTWAPDTRIEVHPIRFGSGDLTAVTGVMEGTFTQPMTLPDGTVVPPTNLAFAIDMATIGKWTAEGVMSEEWLFWDNATFYGQIGL
jgi:SnoaL-like polyketide cyclase